jgi:hypothetical protein
MQRAAVAIERRDPRQQHLQETAMSPTETPQPQQETHLRESVKHLANDSVELIRQASHSTKATIKKPTTGAAIAGAAVMGAVVALGIVPTALAGAAAYAGYRLLRSRRGEEGAA